MCVFRTSNCHPKCNCCSNGIIFSHTNIIQIVEMFRLMCNSSTSGAPTCLERESFRIGSKEHISLVVTVANGREDSFESHLYLTIPVGLDYSRFIRLSQVWLTFFLKLFSFSFYELLDCIKDFPVVCTAPKDYTTHDKTLPYTVDCEIGNPLPKGKTVTNWINNSRGNRLN